MWQEEIAAFCLCNCFEDLGLDFNLRRAIYLRESPKKEGKNVANGYAGSSAAVFSMEQTMRYTYLRLGCASQES